MHPYSGIDATAAWKKLRFILSVRSDFHIIDSLLIAVHAFVKKKYLQNTIIFIYQFIYFIYSFEIYFAKYV